MSLDAFDENGSADRSSGRTITRAELANAVYEATQMNRRSALKFVGETLEEIASCLAQGEDVMLTGFGRFEVRLKGERVGRNPKTGEPATITPRRSIVFRASKIMRRQVATQPAPADRVAAD